MASDSQPEQQGQDQPGNYGGPFLQDAAAVERFVAGCLLHPLETASSIGPTLSELTLGFAGESFVPETDIRDLTGQVVFITGGGYLNSLHIHRNGDRTGYVD